MNYKEKGQNRMFRFALFNIFTSADLLNQTVTFKYFVNGFQRIVELFDRVGRHQREADQRIFRRNGRRYYRVYEDTGFEQFFYDQECQIVVADKQRNAVWPISQPILRKPSSA